MMRAAWIIVPGFLLFVSGCAAGGGTEWDTAMDAPADVTETSGDLPVDPLDTSDPSPDPDAVDSPPDAWDVVPDETDDPPVETVDTFDPPPDTTFDPDVDPELPPDTWETLDWRPERPEIILDTSIEYIPDPAGDCLAGTCTDYVGRTVCVGGSGFIICPLDVTCLQLCVCDAPGVWSICLMPCFC